VIYHIATRADWEQAMRDGQYTTSTIGKTLAEEGFIHASSPGQVLSVANAFYQNAGEDLVVLVIDPERVTAEIRLDYIPEAGATFPHIYGPLNADAVLAAWPLTAGPDGEFATFTPWS